MNQKRSPRVPPRWLCLLLWLGTIALLFCLFRSAYLGQAPAPGNAVPTGNHPAQYCGTWFDTSADRGQILYLFPDGKYRIDTAFTDSEGGGAPALQVETQTGTWRSDNVTLSLNPPLPGWTPDDAGLGDMLIADSDFVYAGVPQQSLRRDNHDSNPDDPTTAFFRRVTYSPTLPIPWYTAYTNSGYPPAGY